ncbi:unnamed protein product [Cylicocyclus nassatus]|uniref:Metalloendopeptidase n=1 Tax=Cylicocyclus nassatus TaxID=53992 RepID=A0AA36GQ42_CYLNA|nr:unnamed protein product [Cylicocyclus nassatus]
MHAALLLLPFLTSVLPAPKRAKPVVISKQKYGDIVQFQQLMKRGMYKSSRTEIKRTKWNHKDGKGNIIIPYIITAEDYDAEETSNITKAMKRIEDRTCIRFAKRRNQKYYVEIRNVKDKGCYAYVGRNKRGFISVLQLESSEENTCMSIPSILHELLHIVGLWHEQNRYDRDMYIQVNYENIGRLYYAQFKKLPHVDSNIYNVSYDYLSIMHYDKGAFPRKGGKGLITMETLDPKYQDLIGHATDATENDYLKVCEIYACKRCKLSKRIRMTTFIL